MLRALADECLRREFEGFNAQDMANVINAYARLEHDPGEAVLRLLADKCMSKGFEGFRYAHILSESTLRSLI